MLAFSSIGQLATSSSRLGTCVALVSSSDPTLVGLATLAFCGAVLHAINHGIFKGLLFFNAGSMFQATGTQDLNQMGGLMEVHAADRLHGADRVVLDRGCAAVQRLCQQMVDLRGGGSRDSRRARYLAVCAVIAILTSALTLACTSSFSARASCRAPAAGEEQAAPAGAWKSARRMQLPQVVLARAVLLGVWSGAGSGVPGSPALLDGSRQGFAAARWRRRRDCAGAVSGLGVSPGPALCMPLVIGPVMAVAFLIACAILEAGRQRSAGPATSWLCGYVREADCYRYGARNFYGEIKRHFSGWAEPRSKARE